jgi:glutaredoxin
MTTPKPTPVFARCGMRSAAHAALGLLLACSGAWVSAQYKVVQPDGSVTYTDRAPSSGDARVTSLGRSNVPAVPAPADAALPPELRQAVKTYPVTLFTTPECTPCDKGRQLLQQRGIPYSERRVVTAQDVAALERTVGSRDVPSLMIGPQPLRAFAEAEWQSYLDVAGYPRESKLPRDWPAVQPVPMVEPTPAPLPARKQVVAAPAAAPSAATSTIRF